MEEKRTVMFVLGTRPEAIKLAPVILEMQQEQNGLCPVVCVTGQHRHMLDQVLEWFRITPDYDLDLMRDNQDLSELAGRALAGLGAIFRRSKPDYVLVQGDTTTAAIAALAAFYHRIPVGHVEAGLRTRDVYNPFPEEMNRRVAGVVARYHFAPTQTAANALLEEHVDPQCIHVVGNTVVDALRITRARGTEIDPVVDPSGRRMILVTAHRRESFGSPFESICRAIRALAERNDDIELVYPVHLNPNVRDPVSRHLTGHPRIRLIEPVRYEQFVTLMVNSYFILTDSGGIQEEATVLGKPTLVLRNTTERPEAIRSGTAKLVGTECGPVLAAAEELLDDQRVYYGMARCNAAFGDGYSSSRILGVLASAEGPGTIGKTSGAALAHQFAPGEFPQ